MAERVKTFRITVGGRTYRVEVGDLSHSPVPVTVDGAIFQVEVEVEPPQPRPRPRGLKPEGAETPVPRGTPPVPQAPAPQATGRVVKAPMFGKILAIKIREGDRVRRGGELCLLEAMKMEQVIRSPWEGVVRAIPVREGQSVAYGDPLVEFE